MRSPTRDTVTARVAKHLRPDEGARHENADDGLRTTRGIGADAAFAASIACAQQGHGHPTLRRAAGLFTVVTPFAASRLLDVLEQRSWPELERPRELRDGSQPGFAAGALKQRHLGAVQVAGVAERFLREAGGEPSGTEVRRELRYRIHAVNARRLRTEPLQTTRCTRAVARVIVCALRRADLRPRGATMTHHHNQQAAARPPAMDLAGPTIAGDGVRP